MTPKSQETAEGLLRSLERINIPHTLTGPIWKYVAKEVEEYENGVPGIVDSKYTCPSTIPSITQHFDDGLAVLEPHTMWEGYHYTLTPGQRKWFREFTGMTPSKTVTIDWIQLWKGTQHPRSFKVVSDIHIDPKHRKHLITEFVIRNAGEFFEKSQEFDNEKDEIRQGILTRDTLQLGYYYTLSQYQKWVVEDLGNCKISPRVQVTHVGDTLRMEEQIKNGTVVTVDREEFFTLSEENEKLYADKSKKSRSRTAASKVTFEETMAELEAQFG